MLVAIDRILFTIERCMDMDSRHFFNRDMIMDTDTYFSTFLSYLYLNTTYTGSYINTTLFDLVVLRTPGPINKHLPLKSTGLEFRNRSTF